MTMPLIQKRFNTTSISRDRTLAATLKHRCSIQRQIKTPVAVDKTGKLTAAPLGQTFETITSLWCGIQRSSSTDFIRAIRGVNTSDETTHYIILRSESGKNLGGSFSSGFSTGSKSGNDINTITGDMYVFLETSVVGVGRRLKITGVVKDELNDEYVYLKCCEIKEVGTGHG